MVRKLPVTLFLLLLAATVSAAAEVKVATLNCFLLFDPRIDHRGKLNDEQRMSLDQYNEKPGNLASLMRGYDVVGIQETGGRAEVDALAAKAGMKGLLSLAPRTTLTPHGGAHINETTAALVGLGW
jgi:hypothetical protein